MIHRSHSPPILRPLLRGSVAVASLLHSLNFDLPQPPPHTHTKPVFLLGLFFAAALFFLQTFVSFCTVPKRGAKAPGAGSRCCALGTMPHVSPLPAARSNGTYEPESKARSLTAGSAQPFLTDIQRAALDAALAAKLTTLTTGATCACCLVRSTGSAAPDGGRQEEFSAVNQVCIVSGLSLALSSAQGQVMWQK